MGRSVVLAEVDAVREFVKKAIRSRPLIPFHLDEFFTGFPKWLEELTERIEGGEERFRSLLKDSVAIIENECPGLKIRLRNNLHGADFAIAGPAEWTDILSYAHGTGAHEALRTLSPSAAARGDDHPAR